MTVFRANLRLSFFFGKQFKICNLMPCCIYEADYLLLRVIILGYSEEKESMLINASIGGISSAAGKKYTIDAFSMNDTAINGVSC